MGRSDCQGIPAARQRTNSMSSTNSGSSSWGSSIGSPTNSPPHDPKIPPRQANMRDRSRHDSGGSIFLRRNDYSAFNVLPRQKINSYHIKMEDECSIGNDETRCFILSNYATHKMNRVPCVLCNTMMIIFERYPLIDGTFFVSPRQHTPSCIQVKADGRICYLLLAACHSSRTEVQLLLRLQPDRQLSPLRGAGLPLHQGPGEDLPVSRGHHSTLCSWWRQK